ncbi:response regulator [Candidatus Woesearchaeota archaeon]|nr:response regulator [Candidatus Woesearchaeota archaeon]
MAKILIVDDSKFEGNQAKMIIQELGHDAELARSYDQALLMYKNSEYDIVLMDILMEEKDGIVMFQEFRRIKDVPILFISSLDEKELEQLTKENKAQGYICKPIDPEDAQKVLDELLL